LSRALNIDATQENVLAACAKHDAAISTIETLPGGCTRVVLRSGDGAALIQRHFGKSVVTKTLARTPLSLASRGVPMTQDLPPSAAPAQTFGFKKR